MFTGIVETVGEIVEVTAGKGASRIGIESDLPLGEVADGDSIAVDGTCLTVTRRDENRYYADVVEETLSVTTLGTLRPGSRVNLERSLRLGDRLDGHLVQGHVDGTGEVLGVRHEGDDWRVEIGVPPGLRRYIALKGSVTVAGVSLTVAKAGEDRLEVALVPHTLRVTNLSDLKVADRVNLEVDLMARYLERLLQDRPGLAMRDEGTDPSST